MESIQSGSNFASLSFLDKYLNRVDPVFCEEGNRILKISYDIAKGGALIKPERARYFWLVHGLFCVEHGHKT
jgi:hypothetical protein